MLESNRTFFDCHPKNKNNNNNYSHKKTIIKNKKEQNSEVVCMDFTIELAIGWMRY